MVELSKRLGYGAPAGALQANFGTPQENGIAALQAKVAVAKAAGNQAEADRLEAELTEKIENVKPGSGPDDSWATADLDVNEDGVVDERDLEALDQSGAGAGQDDNAPPS
jgi:surface antigen